MKTIYGLTLTLTLLLAVFAAIAGSVLLASSMTAPLLQLADGTKAVAEGNYAPVREYPGSDELNLLTQSFNAMTRQLTDARDAVETKQREVENAKTYLERVLANLSAGVIVLDHEFPPGDGQLRRVADPRPGTRRRDRPPAEGTGPRAGDGVRRGFRCSRRWPELRATPGSSRSK